MSNNVCGDKRNPITSNFPYLYFYDPLDSITYRMCVDSCPTYSSSAATVSVPNAASDTDVSWSSSWNVVYDTSGGHTGTPGTAGQFNGYDSYLLLGRLCVPNANMFSTAFTNITSTASSAFQQGDLGNFISDLKNVTAI